MRPDAPVQLLFTGHMDTVFGADHPFQQLAWREEGVLGGPGVADMKGGIAVMLAALKAVEQSPLASSLGYEIVINSRRGGRFARLGGPARAGGAGQARGADLRARRSARRHARRRAAGQRQFLDLHHRARARMPGAIPRTGATRSSPPRTSRCGWPRPRARASRSIRRGSTAAAPTMSCPTTPCCASTCARFTPEDQDARQGRARRRGGDGRRRA